MLEYQCLNQGRLMKDQGWSHWAEDRLYLNLHGHSQQVLCLSPGRAEVLPNTTNPEGISLGEAGKMRPIRFDPSVKPSEVAPLIRQLVLDALACSPDNRLLLLVWLLSALFQEFVEDKALLKLSGASKAGKTTATRIFTRLLYGKRRVGVSTAACLYSDASENPLVIYDNLETRNRSDVLNQFLIQVAGSGERGKRRQNTDQGKVCEETRSLVAITAIEPLTLPELINRTFEVPFQARYKKPGFLSGKHKKRLLANRDRILSGLFNLFAEHVLPGLEERCHLFESKLKAVYEGHSKDRMDSHMSLMIVLTEALLRILEPSADPRVRCWELAASWIRDQEERAAHSEHETNKALYLLEVLSEELLKGGGESAGEYVAEFKQEKNEANEPLRFSFQASSKQLLKALQKVCRNQGLRPPFDSPLTLNSRLLSEAKVLEKAGWSRELEKTVRGTRFYRHTKELTEEGA